MQVQNVYVVIGKYYHDSFHKPDKILAVCATEELAQTLLSQLRRNKTRSCPDYFEYQAFVLEQ